MMKGFWCHVACALNAVFLFQEFFENPAFRADGLKIYPTLVIRGTGKFRLLTLWTKTIASSDFLKIGYSPPKKEPAGVI